MNCTSSLGCASCIQHECIYVFFDVKKHFCVNSTREILGDPDGVFVSMCPLYTLPTPHSEDLQEVSVGWEYGNNIASIIYNNIDLNIYCRDALIFPSIAGFFIFLIVSLIQFLILGAIGWSKRKQCHMYGLGRMKKKGTYSFAEYLADEDEIELHMHKAVYSSQVKNPLLNPSLPIYGRSPPNAYIV